MNKRKFVIGLLIVLTLGAGLIYFALSNVAPYAIIMPARVHVYETPEDLGLESEKLELSSEEGLKLIGYQVDSNIDSTKAAIILIHGIGSCKEHFLQLSKRLADKGIMTLVFDGRAHGESGGQYCTYGYHEKKDISKMVSYIKDNYPELPIGVWGASLGGAIAIQALEYDERINFGIIESTFAELDQITYDYMKRLLKGIGNRTASDFALKKAGEIAQFNPKEVSPIASVTNIEQPVIIAHGDADSNISYHYGEQLYEQLKSKHKEFIKVEGADHYNLSAIGGEKFYHQMMSFIESSINKSMDQNKITSNN